MDRVLIIIPTYNESENIVNLIRHINSISVEGYKIDILIIDDNSDDGTSGMVKELKLDNIKVIDREKKMGLGTAYIRGFKYAIENNYDHVFEMDADFSHDPDSISDFLKYSKEYDLVIGSRYIHGIAVVNWPLSRLIISMGASIYTRLITFLSVKDVTAGFMCYKVSSLNRYI